MGWPVRQSLSPELFYETFSGHADVLDRFSYDLLEEDTFAKAFERFQMDYYAVNVTIPYKEPAFRAADEPSAQCRAIGAANLLIHQGDRVVAHNTDIIAVTDILRNHLSGHIRVQEGPICTPDDIQTGLRVQESPICTPRPKVLVVGCGGAGKAAVAAALSENAEVTVANRTHDTVLRFLEDIKKIYPEENLLQFTPLETLPDEVRRTDFIIYTIPVTIPELEHCDFTGKTVLEAKYYDPSIKQIPGMNYIPGTEWLRLQALATYRILGLIQ